MSEKTKEGMGQGLSALSLSMREFQALAVVLSAEIPIMIRGRHGIGKSQSVYQIAKKLGLPVIERRLSQMTEGDIIGLPDLDAKATEFRPVRWLIDACENPVVLFLDELNRAIKGVEQATFQLADSRAFYGHKLHPETRIITACNIGENYNVEQFDPAAISRYAIIDLDPTIEDFFAWGQETNEETGQQNIDSCLIDFLRSNPMYLEHTSTFEPNVKYADRRAWARANKELVRLGLYQKPEGVLFNHIVSSIVGPMAGPAFWKFAIEREKDISALDVLTNWGKVKKRLPADQVLRSTKIIEIAWKLSPHVSKNKLDEKQIKQLALFLSDASNHPEAPLVVWQGIYENEENLLAAYREGALASVPQVARGLPKGDLAIANPTSDDEKNENEDKSQNKESE